MMSKVKEGDKVRVHYTGKLDDGKVFDTSVKRDPLEFTLGSKQLIPGFEEAVLGMSPGDKKEVKIPKEKAYGPYVDDMVMKVGKDKLPENLTPEVGQQLEIRQPNGQAMIVKITDVADSEITIDANHPLAGKDLTFEIELMEIS